MIDNLNLLFYKILIDTKILELHPKIKTPLIHLKASLGTLQNKVTITSSLNELKQSLFLATCIIIFNTFNSVKIIFNNVK
jgi:hypothetical protein